MKRVFTLLFVSMLVGHVWANYFQSGDLSYNTTSDSTVEVTYNVNYLGLAEAIIPEMVTYYDIEYAVTSIGERAFYGCSGLTSVTIPNSVTLIGNYAFYGCNGLTSVTIPNSIEIIYEAFPSCNNLKYNEYNNALYLGNDLNPYCCLVKVKSTDITSCGINNNCKIICPLAFRDCDILTSVTIPNSVTSIGYCAFEGCSSLAEVTIPNSVTCIGDDAFEGCSSLAEVTIPNSVTYIGGRAFYNCNILTSVTIPNSLTSIGDYVFYNCSNLKYNEYNNALYLGNDLNPYCCLVKAKSTDITSCEINKNCKIVCPSAFRDCDILTSVNIECSISLNDAGLFFTKDNFRYYVLNKDSVLVSSNSYTGDVVIPESVTAGNTFVVSGIQAQAFINSSITSVTIPNSVKSIESEAFFGCSGLTSITIPDSVTCIGSDAFSHCSSLISATIGNSVTYIKGWAFRGCGSLKTVYFNAQNCSSMYNGDYPIFEDCSSFNTLIIGDNVETIPDYAFYRCRSITSVTIPSTIKKIGESAFGGCRNIQCSQYDNALYIGNEENPYLVLVSGIEGCTECEVNTNCKHINNKAFISGLDLGVFYEFWQMQRLISKSTVPPLLSGGLDVPYTVYVPVESVEVYKTSQWWSEKNILPCILNVTIKSNDINCGIVSGGGNYNVGEVAKLIATPVENCYFVKWSDGDTSNPRTYQVYNDTTITAIFEVGVEVSTPVTESAANAVNIYAHGNTIIVENATDEIFIYDAMGRLVGRDDVHIVSRITVNGTGVYIVKTGGMVKRVMVN